MKSAERVMDVAVCMVTADVCGLAVGIWVVVLVVVVVVLVVVVMFFVCSLWPRCPQIFHYYS